MLLLITAIAVLAIIALIACLLARLEPAKPTLTLPEPCRLSEFEGDEFIVCKADTSAHRISLHLKDLSGKPWQEMKRFASAMRPLFAMNAGMYHSDLSPVGLYAEEGHIIAPVEVRDGPGNFYIQPNGIFSISRDGTALVETTEIFMHSGRDIWSATQSGPMLVIDGAINVRFEPNGTSRHVRNGVGIDTSGGAVFAISREPVSFGRFARLFRDELRCRNALYLDGAISAFAAGAEVQEGGSFPVGPIVAVFE